MFSRFINKHFNLMMFLCIIASPCRILFLDYLDKVYEFNFRNYLFVFAATGFFNPFYYLILDSTIKYKKIPGKIAFFGFFCFIWFVSCLINYKVFSSLSALESFFIQKEWIISATLSYLLSFILSTVFYIIMVQVITLFERPIRKIIKKDAYQIGIAENS